MMKYTSKKEILNYTNLAEIAWAAIEPLWDDLPLSNISKLKSFLSEITEGQMALISIDWCQKEIRNGGIEQLFVNSTGNLVPYAIEGFKLIGAEQYAQILLEASLLLGLEYPDSAAKRKRALKSLDESEKKMIEKFDDEFLNLLDSSNYDIEYFRGNFVKNNPGQFVRLWE